MNRSKTELADLAKNYGIDLAETCRKAKTIETITGFPMIIETEDEIMVLV